MNSYQVGTKEFQPVSITSDGNVVTSNFQLAILPRGVLPTDDDWVDPDILDNELGFFVEDYAAGAYYVYSKIQANPEVPLLLIGTFAVVAG